MLKNGTYRARAVDWEVGMSRTNKEQVAIRFQLTTGPDEGKSVTWYGYFNTPENAKRSIESLRYCGWQGNDLMDLTGLDANEVELVIEDELYEGKTRAKVRWINEIGGGPALSKPMSDVQKQAFANRMKGIAMATKPIPPKESYPADWDK